MANQGNDNSRVIIKAIIIISSIPFLDREHTLIKSTRGGSRNTKKRRPKMQISHIIFGSQHSLQDVTNCETEVISVGQILFVRRLTNSFFGCFYFYLEWRGQIQRVFSLLQRTCGTSCAFEPITVFQRVLREVDLCLLKICVDQRRSRSYDLFLKGGPEPLEKDINEILGSKHEDQISDPFFELVPNTTLVRFSYLLRLCNFCKAPRDMQNPAEVPEDSRVLRARRLCTQLLIASTPGSSSLERPGLENTTRQPWSDATCPCTTSWSAYFRSVTLFLLKRARQSTRSGVTRARCVRPWLTRSFVWTGTGSFRRGCARFRGDRRLRT